MVKGLAFNAAIIGLDGARPDLVKMWADEGKLPNIAELMERGVFMEAIPSMPHTMAGWNCIATGARIGTSKISLGLHILGEPITSQLGGTATDMKYCKAETLWQAAARAGKRSILFNYRVRNSDTPGAIPVKNGINVSPGEEPWATPPEVGEELEKALGPRRPRDQEWEADVSAHLVTHYEWDLFMMHTHNIDGVQHRYLYYTVPSLPGWTPEKGEEARKMVLQGYRDSDRLVGKIAKVLGDDTLTVVVSDHGNTVTHTQVLINNLLVREGLLKVNFRKEAPQARRGARRRGERRQYEVDLSRTKALAAGQWHIYINVKGRDPGGIVEPGKEYREVQDRIIKLLYDLKSPKTGEPCISIAVRGEDAAGLDYYGPSGLYGDVVFAARPGYTLDPPVTEDLLILKEQPGVARHGMHHPTFRDVHAVCIMSGAGVKKGHVRDRPIHLTDMAPTVAHIAGMPIPAQADGTVLHDIIQKEP